MKKLVLLLAVVVLTSCMERPYYIRNPYSEMMWAEGTQYDFHCERVGLMSEKDYYDVPPIKKHSLVYLEVNGDVLRQFGNYVDVYERTGGMIAYHQGGCIELTIPVKEGKSGGAPAWITITSTEIIIEIPNPIAPELSEFILLSNDCRE